MCSSRSDHLDTVASASCLNKFVLFKKIVLFKQICADVHLPHRTYRKWYKLYLFSVNTTRTAQLPTAALPTGLHLKHQSINHKAKHA